MTASDRADRRTLDNPDGFYEALIAAHEGLDAEASQRLNARLVLLLATEIGDDVRLRSILEAAIAASRTATGTAD